MTDEAKRLEALLDYGLLDTPAEPAFDELTELAAEVCETPISMISLVDEERQWFKAKVGVDVSETPRCHSFCAHALYQRDLFIVSDASADARFADYPMVMGDEHVRFYAGAPLLTRDGMALGTLCVLDRTNRQLSGIQKKTLHILGRQVMAQFELRRRTLALAESEALLVKLFRNCPVAVALKSWREEIFLHVNTAFACLAGCPPEEIVGRTTSEVLRVEGGGAEGGREYAVSIRNKAGERRRVLIDSTVVLDAREPQVITTYVDITDLERAEESLNLSAERIRRLHTLVAPFGEENGPR